MTEKRKSEAFRLMRLAFQMLASEDLDEFEEDVVGGNAGKVTGYLYRPKLPDTANEVAVVYRKGVSITIKGTPPQFEVNSEKSFKRLLSP